MKKETLRKISKLLFFLGAIVVIAYIILLSQNDAGLLLPICMLFTFPLAIVLHFTSEEHAAMLSLSSLSLSMVLFTHFCSYGYINIGYVLACLILGNFMYFKVRGDSLNDKLLTTAVGLSFLSNCYFITGYMLYLSKIALVIEVIVLFRIVYKKFLKNSQ